MPSPGLTELEAVNAMLGLIGEAPVASIEDDLIVDAAMALGILREATRTVLEVGWHFNTDEDFELVPDVDGFIYIPSDAVRVDSDWNDVAVRGDRLYNKDTNTYVWSTPLRCTIVRYMDWADIPSAVRRYIAAKATTLFATRTMGSSEIVNQARSEEATIRSLMLSQELEMADYSLLDNLEIGKGVMRVISY